MFLARELFWQSWLKFHENGPIALEPVDKKVCIEKFIPNKHCQGLWCSLALQCAVSHRSRGFNAYYRDEPTRSLQAYLTDKSACSRDACSLSKWWLLVLSKW